MQSPPPAEARTSRAIRLFPSSTRKTRRDHRHEPEHHDAAHGGDISHGFLKGGRTDGALSGGRLNITRNVRSKFCSRWPSPRQLEQLRRQVLRAEEFNSQFAGLQRYITREITHAPRSPRPAALLRADATLTDISESESDHYEMLLRSPSAILYCLQPL
jgi:hypothetical protein